MQVMAYKKTCILFRIRSTFYIFSECEHIMEKNHIIYNVELAVSAVSENSKNSIKI